MSKYKSEAFLGADHDWYICFKENDQIVKIFNVKELYVNLVLLKEYRKMQAA